jgi:hypothetical protein
VSSKTDLAQPSHEFVKIDTMKMPFLLIIRFLDVCIISKVIVSEIGLRSDSKKLKISIDG